MSKSAMDSMDTTCTNLQQLLLIIISLLFFDDIKET